MWRRDCDNSDIDGYADTVDIDLCIFVDRNS